MWSATDSPVGALIAVITCRPVRPGLLNHTYDNAPAIDGKFGTGTETAVRAVQKCSGLTHDGQVGPQTREFLDAPMPGCGR
ncbi:peptidoglycan-binding protein [Streptomyces inhibens]|uniref:Peptidoglycan-binding protein n=1 Tax=Streptomyces inhibens TaxID=2293571 RepID=A0A371Q822_STRIH|nr:peptidoglycan-binding domain-containing protein [Streptomyces inhibens]REK90819.1 peptidoglycan-binding protein [Streptomyces inhibens]